jgi:hypothetical protein
MRTTLVAACVAAVLAAAGAGCRPKAQPPRAAVATFEGGSVSAEDLDHAILDVPSHQRQPADGDLLAWYERIARDLALQQILLREARAEGLDRSPQFAAARAEAAKRAAVAEFLETELPRATVPAEAAIKAYYDAHRDEFRTEASRETWHLFRRFRSGADPKAVMAEVARLRERVVAGQDFRELAAAQSESESRHRKGLLGWVRHGQVNAELERVIFSLEPGVPSQPLRTREGVHLFLVSSETPARAYAYADVRTSIAMLLMNQAREAEIRKRVGAPPAGASIPDAAAWKRLLEAGDPQAMVLEIGDLRLTLAEFQARLLALQTTLDLSVPVTPQALLQTLVDRELIFLYCRAKGIDRSPGAQARLNRMTDRELAGLRLRERLLARADTPPGRLQEYHAANRARFSEPLGLRLVRLRVPLSAHADQAMARLEQARPQLDRGQLTLGALAAELGGTVEEAGWQTLDQIARGGPRGAELASGLAAGRHSPPYRNGDQIEMLMVSERREPAPLPFERVREQVRTDFVFTHLHEEYSNLVKEVLAEKGFQVAREPLEELLRRPPGAAI